MLWTKTEIELRTPQNFGSWRASHSKSTINVRVVRFVELLDVDSQDLLQEIHQTRIAVTSSTLIFTSICPVLKNKNQGQDGGTWYRHRKPDPSSQKFGYMNRCALLVKLNFTIPLCYIKDSYPVPVTWRSAYTMDQVRDTPPSFLHLSEKKKTRETLSNKELFLT